MDEKLKEQAKTIAKKAGYENQSMMLIEECSELIQAVSKYKRAVTREERTLAYLNYLEEIADVELMLFQIKYLLALPEEDIEAVKVCKVNRTLERMDLK